LIHINGVDRQNIYPISEMEEIKILIFNTCELKLLTAGNLNTPFKEKITAMIDICNDQVISVAAMATNLARDLMWHPGDG
jgi:hypothetical protein